VFLEKARDLVYQVHGYTKINSIKQIWVVQTRGRNQVKLVKQLFLKIDTKSFKHGGGVVTGSFTLAIIISWIMSGMVAVGVGH